MSSSSLNRLPLESNSFEWILRMIGGLEAFTFANAEKKFALGDEKHSRVTTFEWLSATHHSKAKSFTNDFRDLASEGNSFANVLYQFTPHLSPSCEKLTKAFAFVLPVQSCAKYHKKKTNFVFCILYFALCLPQGMALVHTLSEYKNKVQNCWVGITIPERKLRLNEPFRKAKFFRTRWGATPHTILHHQKQEISMEIGRAHVWTPVTV